jgi:hypothetical protein
MKMTNTPRTTFALWPFWTALVCLLSVLFSLQSATAATLYPTFDARSQQNVGPANSNTSDLGVGSVSATTYFRTYMTFDLSALTTNDLAASAKLKLFNIGAEGNSNVLAQVYTLFQVSSNWNGTAAPGPEGTALATVNITPASGTDTQNIEFSSTNLANAFNSAIGTILYLGIKTDKELFASARSFTFFQSTEDPSKPALSTIAVNLPTITVSVPDDSMSEPGTDTATFTLNRSVDTNSVVTVFYTSSGTATQGSDYTESGSGSVTFAAGVIATNIVVSVVNDAVAERLETVILTVTPNANYDIGSPSAGTATVIDDNDDNNDVLVRYIFTDANSTGSTFSLAAQVYSTNISATALVPVGITLGNSGATVSPPNAGYINSTLTTSNQTAAIANDDYFSFTLTPTIGKSLTLTNLELSAVYSVTASSGVNASLFVRSSLDNYTSNVASNSFSFLNPYTVMSVPLGAAFTQVPTNITFRVYVFDDTDTTGDGLRIDDIFVRGSLDALPLGFQQVNIVATGPNAAEPSTPGEFTVTRFGDTAAPLTVNYSISGTAFNGVDYVTLPGQVTIGAGQTNATIAVTPIDDPFSEGIETVTLTLLADPANAVVPPASATINIADDLEPALSPTVTAFFGFDATRSDADGLLGTHQPSDTFDNQDSAASFNVTAGYLNATTKDAAWIVLNDDQPEATNAAPPASVAAFRGGVPLTIRTRLQYLSSLTTGEAAAAGVLFGLSSANRDTATGWLARVERGSGANTGRLYLDAFVNGARGTNLISGAEFSYGNFDALWFLEVKLTEVMGATHCRIGLIADSQIPGSGSDPSRLTSVSFATAERAAQISSDLPAGVSGLVGLHFEDNTQASPTNPLDGVGRFSNLFVYGGGGATNNEYSLQMLEDGSLTLINLASSVGAVLAPEFTILYCASNPQLDESSVAETMHGGSTSVGLNVATWAAKSNTQNLWNAPDLTTKVRPQSAWQIGEQVWWRCAPTNGFALKAEVVLPDGSKDPNITFHLTPTTSGYYSTAFSGIPACPTNSLDWLWQPLIWQGLRFPLTGYLTPEYLCSLPGVMLSQNGSVMGAVADPGEMPFRLPLFANSLFGVVLRGPGSLAQPMVFAPLLGGTKSYMPAGSTFNFSTHVFARSGDFYQNFRRLTTNTFGFHDYRQNATATLNQALDNMSDYFLTPYANWDANARGFSGLRDDPDTVKSYSPVHVLSWAMVRDSQQFYEVRARPVIEYSLSRSTYFLSIGSYNANEAMFGPVLSSLTPEYCALHLITGGRTAYFGKVVNDLNANLLSAVNTNTTYTGQQALDNGRSYLRRCLAMFRMSGGSAYLAQARKCADDYIAWRIAQPQTDFYDAASSFWAFIGPMWTDLLELYDETGEPRYRDAALAGAREFVGYNYFCPKIPAGDITVNIGGSVSGMPIPQETVPAWRVSEMGLQCEAASTSLSHRGIFMVPWAAYFNRLAALSGDTYLRDVARAVVVGRYANFPGYNEKTVYTTLYEKPNYPLRTFDQLTYNSFHYHHPMLMAAELVDYLVSEADLRSLANIRFPARYSAMTSYFQSKVYGDRPGTFYGQTNAWLWLPQALLTTSSLQVNYLAAYTESNLCLALMNQSDQPVTTSVNLNGTLAPFGALHAVQVWTNSIPAPDTTLASGSTTVTIPAKGLTALVIQGLPIQTSFQRKYRAASPALGAQSYASVTNAQFGAVRSCLISLGPTLTSAYVWLQACPANATDPRSGPLKEARLKYSINGGPTNTLVDADWPFEFTVPLASTEAQFRFWVEGVTPANQLVATPQATILKNDSYAAWAATKFSAAELANPAVSGADANPEGDGQSNWMEYTYGLEPKIADATQLDAQILAGHLTISYRRNSLASQATITPEISSDLISWQSGPTNLVEIASEPLGGGVERVTVQDVENASAGPRFVRLRLGFAP